MKTKPRNNEPSEIGQNLFYGIEIRRDYRRPARILSCIGPDISNLKRSEQKSSLGQRLSQKGRPLKCSGLGVERQDIDKLAQTLGNGFDLVLSFREQHKTPFDTMQTSFMPNPPGD